ncbi:FtsQ-type POTRA domain-containing protein [Devosia sp. WQ 349]|uniref:cell division protein FtsQ/DivIB n=1 Tax=Devosia sp. WQ 349K1 TaxID=2800329 RepID=UPI001904E8F0|nr:FtsQ-type POTRA domain-containing protein [Devosia sp. WQ 349K1]
MTTRALPVRARAPRRRIKNSLNRVWVLHSGKIRKVFSVALLLAGCAGLYQVREPIGNLAMIGVELAQAQFAHAGLAVSEISISGQTLTSEQDVFDALAIQLETSTMSFDVDAARKRIAELPAVESVLVRKTYPGKVDVTITEKLPVARWRVDGITFLIDRAGDQIGEDRGAYGDLPLVIGDGAADDALAMIRAIDTVPQLKDELVAISRIADRRWDLIYSTGLRVQLPEQGVAQALRKLQDYQDEFRLLDRDLAQIDLRNDTLVALRPNKPIEETVTTPQ